MAYLEIKRERESAILCPVCKKEWRESKKTCVWCESIFMEAQTPEQTKKFPDGVMIEYSEALKEKRPGTRRPPPEVVRNLQEHGLLPESREIKKRLTKRLTAPSRRITGLISLLEKKPDA